MIAIKALYRYPVKGFPAQLLEHVNLERGEGIQGDREIAIGTGRQLVESEGAWTPCQAFQRMSIRPDLTLFGLHSDAENLKLTNPQGLSEDIEGQSETLNRLSEEFGQNAKIHRRKTGLGYWDHPDAALSIINVATVEQIAKALGRPIDPLRFRANIYLRAEPWSEFKWLGQSLEIGQTQLEIIRPIDRCKTTSVNVKSGVLDVNMPATLQRFFGHMFCGVYANVRHAGQIRANDSAQVIPSTATKAVQNAIAVTTAPALPMWPRPATVSQVHGETPNIRSLWLNDSFGASTELKAGQYIRLHDLDGGQTWRSYTVSAIKDGRIRITVKRDQGLGSKALHHLVEGDTVTISGPFGEATLQDDSTAVHFFSAGIGITPIVAKLSALAEQQDQRPIVVTHVVRSLTDLALWQEVRQLTDSLPNAQRELYLTGAVQGSTNARRGRPNLKALIEQAKTAQANIHICGPSGFVTDLEQQIETAGIPLQQVFFDRFSSPSVAVDMREIAPSKPIKVTLRKSKISAEWRPEDGTLLDFAEKHGVVAPSHCRAGLCKSCQCTVISGTTHRLTGDIGEDQQKTLLCAAVPSGTLTLDI